MKKAVNIAITLYDNDFQTTLMTFLEAMVWRKPTTKKEVVIAFNRSKDSIYGLIGENGGRLVPELKIDNVWLGDEVTTDLISDDKWNGELSYLDVYDNFVVVTV